VHTAQGDVLVVAAEFSVHSPGDYVIAGHFKISRLEIIEAGCIEILLDKAVEGVCELCQICGVLDEYALEKSVIHADIIACKLFYAAHRQGICHHAEHEIIGDGLAAAALDFYDYEEKPDRTRVIIFSTDNDLLGEEIITLPDAGKLCEERDITVFGVGTEIMDPDQRQMMKDTVEGTGGTFYYGEDDDIVENIVDDIRRQIATLDDTQYEIVEYDMPEKPFRLLLFSLSLMLLVAFILKV
jgi:hypothetical protein